MQEVCGCDGKINEPTAAGLVYHLQPDDQHFDSNTIARSIAARRY